MNTKVNQKTVKRISWRHMRVVRWENGKPIKEDKDGNLWSFNKNQGTFCCVLNQVPKTLIEVFAKE